MLVEWCTTYLLLPILLLLFLSILLLSLKFHIVLSRDSTCATLATCLRLGNFEPRRYLMPQSFVEPQTLATQKVILSRKVTSRGLELGGCDAKPQLGTRISIVNISSPFSLTKIPNLVCRLGLLPSYTSWR